MESREGNDLPRPTVTDECTSSGNLNLTYVDNTSNVNDCRGTILRTWTATDACGLTATCVTIECNGFSNNQLLAQAWNQDNIAKLNVCSFSECGGVNITSDYDFNNLSDECGLTGSLTVVYTITDDCGNSVTKTATFTIEDTTPPIVCVPLNSVINCREPLEAKNKIINIYNQRLDAIQNCASDNCGNVSITSDFNPDLLSEECIFIPSTPITYTITDECGNITTSITNYMVINRNMENDLCNDIDIQLMDNQLTLNGLVAPNTIAKVFDANYQIISNCSGDCPETITIPNLNAGEIYHTDIQFYDENWDFICEDKQDIEIMVGGEPCDTSICQGNVILRTQAEVDAFCGCEVIEGDLLLIGEGIDDGVLGLSSDIFNTEKFTTLKEVKGNLVISNTRVKDFSGFRKMQKLGRSLVIQYNQEVDNLIGFESLDTIEQGVFVFDNPLLENLDDLANLKFFRSLSLSGNFLNIDIIKDIPITKLSNLSLTRCQLLGSLDGLVNIDSITSNSGNQSLILGNNKELKDISVLSTLKFIGGNLEIRLNPKLTSCCPISHLVDNNSENGMVKGDIILGLNPQFCNSPEAIVENCQTPPPLCENIQINTQNNQIVIEGLIAPNEIVKVFDKDFNIVYQCVANCENTQMAGTFPVGDYTIDLQLYDENWELICAEQRAVTVEAGNGNPCNVGGCETIAPVLANIPGDITAECDAIPEISLNITAMDNCDSDVAIQFDETRTNGNCEDTYSLTRTWTATDNCGNTAQSTQRITIIDSTNPVLTNIPADETVECDAVPEFSFNVTATDNCDADVTIEFNEERNDGDCQDSYVLTRTWTASDNCGNLTQGIQVVVVQDNTPPVLTNLPPDLTFNESDGFDTTFPIPTDNCAANPTLTVEDAVNPEETEIVRTFTATDNCGNTATAQQIITIIPDGNNLCESINITTSTQAIMLSNITAPNSIVKVFDPNWQLVFECNADCENELVVPVVGAGVYHTDVQFYDESWVFICEDRQDIEVINEGEPCDTSICNGTVRLINQAEIDAFCGCEVIKGDLVIGTGTVQNSIPTPPTDIVSIDNLSQIKKVEGSLVFFYTQLKDLRALSNIEEIDLSLVLIRNQELKNFKGLEQIDSVLGFIIDNNLKLASFEGLNSLKSVLNISLEFTPFPDLTFFNQLQVDSLNGLSLVNCDELTSLAGVESLEKIRGLTIAVNDKLEDISALNELTLIGNIIVDQNPVLTNCCPLSRWIDGQTDNGEIAGQIRITGNPFACSSVEEILQNCQTLTEPSCTNINIQTTNTSITISNLTAPIEILKVFDANYQIVYECFADCEEHITIPDLAAGTYHININFYDENWEPICERVETVEIEPNSQDRNTTLLPTDFTLYPNPAEAETFIDLSKLKGEPVQLILFNQFGQKVKEQVIEKVTEQKAKIDLSTLQNGLYMLQIKADGKRPIAKKLIINRLY